MVSYRAAQALAKHTRKRLERYVACTPCGWRGKAKKLRLDPHNILRCPVYGMRYYEKE